MEKAIKYAATLLTAVAAAAVTGSSWWLWLIAAGILVYG